MEILWKRWLWDYSPALVFSGGPAANTAGAWNEDHSLIQFKLIPFGPPGQIC